MKTEDNVRVVRRVRTYRKPGMVGTQCLNIQGRATAKSKQSDSRATHRRRGYWNVQHHSEQEKIGIRWSGKNKPGTTRHHLKLTECYRLRLAADDDRVAYARERYRHSVRTRPERD